MPAILANRVALKRGKFGPCGKIAGTDAFKVFLAAFPQAKFLLDNETN
jgi:hypothetical protein